MSCRTLVSTLLLVSLVARNAAAQGSAAPTPGPRGPAASVPAGKGAASAPVGKGAASVSAGKGATSAPAGREPNVSGREPSAAELEAARALFEEARRDEGARRWGDALLKFRRILATRDTASLRFHVAYCEESMGLVASARLDYERAAELAQASKGPDRKLILEESVRSRSELTPRVPTLALALPEGAESARISVDGEIVPTDRLGAALPLDPGHHAIEVLMPGKRPFRREVRLAERERHTVSVLFEPALEFAPPPPSPSTAPGPRHESPTSSRAVEVGRSTPPGAWVAGGAGVAFAGAAAGLVAKGLSQRAELKRCEAAGACDGREVAAASNLNVALGGVAGGLALAGAGTAIWLALRPASKPSAPAAAGLLLGPAGVGWRGVF